MKLNPGGSCSFFAILKFMICIKSDAKNYGRTRDYHERRSTDPAFKNIKNYSIEPNSIKHIHQKLIKIRKNQPGCNLIQKAVVIRFRSDDQQSIKYL